METNNLPSPYIEPERYQGRLLVIIWDNYVLDCIGDLVPERQNDVRSTADQSSCPRFARSLRLAGRMRCAEGHDQSTANLRTRGSGIRYECRSNEQKKNTLQFRHSLVKPQ